MTLSSQLTSLTLSKRLKELGVPQNAYWSWYENAGDAELLHNPDGYRSMEDKTFDAFSVAELGKLLPKSLGNDDQNLWLTINRNNDWWVAHYRDAAGNALLEKYYDHSMAEAMAKMLIHLIEQGLIKV